MLGTRTGWDAADGSGPELDARGLAMLLGRAPRALDGAAAGQAVRGRTVLITGAGGSIGRALARAVARLAPARLVLLDHGEYGLWRVSQEVREASPAIRHDAVIADVRDARRLRQALGDARAEIVLHAAALKHVPIVQDHPLEGLLTNAIGTRNVIDAARAAGCAIVVLVSTDKAVAPASVMGASKRLAEMFGQATDAVVAAQPTPMRCVSVRLGNVMGSAGSVVQLFHRQLAAGEPLTVTHPAMRRYFLAPEEAIGFLLAAVGLAAEGTLAHGAVLAPRMGPPIHIVDLARRMILAAGKQPGRDVAIRFTKPRDGERLWEQPCQGADPAEATGVPGLLAVAPRAPALPWLCQAFDELEAACRAGEERLALRHVSRLIPGFDKLPSINAPRATRTVCVPEAAARKPYR